MEFKVKRDFLLVFLINLVLAFILALALYFSYNAVILTIFLILSVGGIILFNSSVIWASCKINNEELIFKTGVFKYTIKLNTIAKVTPSKNAYGSLSLSFDRLRILTVSEGKQKVYYISVVDNEKLLSVLTSNTKQPKIEKEIVETSTKEVKPTVKKSTTTKKKPTSTTTKKSTTKSNSTKKSTTQKSTKKDV